MNAEPKNIHTVCSAQEHDRSEATSPMVVTTSLVALLEHCVPTWIKDYDIRRGGRDYNAELRLFPSNLSHHFKVTLSWCHRGVSNDIRLEFKIERDDSEGARKIDTITVYVTKPSYRTGGGYGRWKDGKLDTTPETITAELDKATSMVSRILARVCEWG